MNFHLKKQLGSSLDGTFPVWSSAGFLAVSLGSHSVLLSVNLCSGHRFLMRFSMGVGHSSVCRVLT